MKKEPMSKDRKYLEMATRYATDIIELSKCLVQESGGEGLEKADAFWVEDFFDNVENLIYNYTAEVKKYHPAYAKERSKDTVLDIKPINEPCYRNGVLTISGIVRLIKQHGVDDFSINRELANHRITIKLGNFSTKQQCEMIYEKVRAEIMGPLSLTVTNGTYYYHD